MSDSADSPEHCLPLGKFRSVEIEASSLRGSGPRLALHVARQPSAVLWMYRPAQHSPAAVGFCRPAGQCWLPLSRSRMTLDALRSDLRRRPHVGSARRPSFQRPHCDVLEEGPRRSRASPQKTDLSAASLSRYEEVPGWRSDEISKG
jgi:hypothetical protein